MDVERAITRVREFLDLLGRSREIDERIGDQRFDTPEYGGLEEQIRRALPGVRAIARAIDVNLSGRFAPHTVMGEWQWFDARDAAQELLGELESREETEHILGPEGPRLSTAGLHPWVWNAAVDLWDAHYYRQAVLDAYMKVEALTKAKCDTPALNGVNVWSYVFNLRDPEVDCPRLRFPGIDPRDEAAWKSAHEGARFFGMGCAQAMRNWAAHQLDEVDDQTALEYLAALSVLARWVDAARIEHAK